MRARVPTRQLYRPAYRDRAVSSMIGWPVKLKAAVGKLAEADLADVNVLLKEEAL